MSGLESAETLGASQQTLAELVEIAKADRLQHGALP